MPAECPEDYFIYTQKNSINVDYVQCIDEGTDAWASEVTFQSDWTRKSWSHDWNLVYLIFAVFKSKGEGLTLRNAGFVIGPETLRMRKGVESPESGESNRKKASLLLCNSLKKTQTSHFQNTVDNTLVETTAS